MSEALSTEEKIKQWKEQSSNCAICGQPVLFNASSINLVSITESGQVIAPYETEDGGASALLPLCSYHMVLAQQGVIALTTENKIIFARKLSDFERLTDAQLRLKGKLQRNSKILQEESQLCKAIVQARKFQTEMTKQDDEIKKLQEESACEEHKGNYTRECEKCLNQFREASDKMWKEKIKDDIN